VAGKAEGDASLELSGSHVAILGWAGSTPRQLRVVGGFYRRAGAEVLTANADVWRAMARPEGWADEGRKLADRLIAADPERLVIHLFSNAGFWTHAAALRSLPPSFRSRIRAVIIDSAPGFPERIEPGFYASHSTMAMMPMVLSTLGRPPALSHPLLTPPLWAFMRTWYHLSSRAVAAAEESLSVVRTTGTWDHLMLYSASDSLVKPTYVQSFIHRLRAAGRTVEVERWEDGAHVRQMITHRRAYFARVARFLAARVAPLEAPPAS